MSEYKMVPVVPTGVRRKDGWGAVDEVYGSGEFHLEQMSSQHWSLRLGPYLIGLHSSRAIRVTLEVDPPAKVQPFVVTDEVLETAWKAATQACVKGPDYKYVAPVTPEQWFTALRAAIEAVLGEVK